MKKRKAGNSVTRVPARSYQAKKEEAMNNEGISTSTVLLALLGGAALGAGLALLYAPRSGRETRQRLSELGEEAQDYVTDLYEKAEEGLERAKAKGEQWMGKGKEYAEEKKREFNSAMGEGAKTTF
jgi:gas vesicle protein